MYAILRESAHCNGTDIPKTINRLENDYISERVKFEVYLSIYLSIFVYCLTLIQTQKR